MSQHPKMNFKMDLLSRLEQKKIQLKLQQSFEQLWPIHRSITGEGYRQSLKIISRWMPMKITRSLSGKKIFDWVVPEEWSVDEAYLIDPDGKRFADIKENNLHLVAYSCAFKGELPLSELKKHLHTRTDLPDAIPYVTSYYKKTWGFCIKYSEYKKLKKGVYKVFIKSSFKKGYVEVGESYIKGRSKKEILLTSYLCHPSMANNELSGPLALACLYRLLQMKPIEKNEYGIRIVLHPETIGALCFIHNKREVLARHVVGGSVVSCVGLNKNLILKNARNRGSDFERALKKIVIEQKGLVTDFTPFGSDERQYCSLGINLPICLLSRANNFTYREYHTSKDNKSIICFQNILKTAETLYKAIEILGRNKKFKNKLTCGEPFFTKYNLYPTTSTGNAISLGLNKQQEAYVWIMSHADGKKDLINIAEESGLDITTVIQASEDLLKFGLLKK
jgi:aminopeptidase-like protein